MLRRSYYIAFGIILFLALILVSLPSGTTARLKLALSTLFLPLFGLAHSAQGTADRLVAAWQSKRDLTRENERLRLELNELRARSHQAVEAASENLRLRAALDWQKQTPWRLKLGRVLLRDPANWWRSLHINLGHRDGITTNLPVLTAEGLVGCVREVGSSRSRVVLVGAADCRVSAWVEEAGPAPGPGGLGRRSSGLAHGIVAAGPSSLLDPTLVDLTYLDRQSSVKAGQRVVTSGYGGLFPRGIPIGYVAEVTTASYGLFNEARVKLAADLGQLEEVFVLLP